MNKNLILFGGAWCQPCKQAKKLLEVMGVEFTYADIQDNFQLAYKCQIKSIPTLILFVDNNPKGSLVGTITKRRVQELLDSVQNNV
jgi:thioredoxin 1